MSLGTSTDVWSKIVVNVKWVGVVAMLQTEQKKLLIFISHASQDVTAAKLLTKRLKEDGFDPWLDVDRLLPGQDWNYEIEKAMGASDAILLCFSAQSLAKEGYIHREYKRAMSYQEEKPEGTIFVIPVRLDKCEMPRFIREIQWVDYPDDYDKLKTALHIRENKTSTAVTAQPKKDLAEKRAPVPMMPRRSPFFVGRDRELEQICDALRSRYIVQIHGLGGTGKSTLAIEAAHRMEVFFTDGILWLFAPEYEKMELLLNSLANFFGIEISSMTFDDKKAYLPRMLADKQALLILDNVEYATVVEEIIALLPGFPILITSRPHIKLVRVARWIDLGELYPQEAIKLFLEVSSRPISERERQTIADICSKLGNFPLAIELAAKLFRYSFPELEELSRIVGNVINNMPDSLDDRNVAASFLATYEALDQKEKSLFNTLGVFPGRTFDRQAIIFVAKDFRDEEVELALRTKLIPLSLVRYEERRYSLHPLLKDFACSHLSSAEPYKRMARYFAEYASSHRENFSLLELERANLFGAIDWSFENHEYDLVVDMVQALVTELSYFSFLSQRGYWNEAIHRLEQEEIAIQNASATRDSGRITLSLGLFHYYLGNHHEARKANDLARQDFEKRGDTAGLIISYWQSGYIEDDEDNYKNALDLYNKSLELANGCDDCKSHVRNSRKLVGVVKYHKGDYEEARADMEQSLSEAEASHNNPDIATCQRRLAAVIRRQAVLASNEQEKQNLLEQSRKLLNDCQQIETHKRGIARLERQFGMLEQTAGRIDEAKNYFESSLEAFRKIGDRKGVASVLYNLGTILQEQHELEEARQLYHDSLEIGKTLKVRLGIALNLRQLALIEHKFGNIQEALRLKTEAMNILETIHSPYIDESRLMLSDLQFGGTSYERHEFSNGYDRLWEDAMTYLKRGHVDTDSYLLDLHNDKRRGLSVIAFLNQGRAQENQNVIQELRFFIGNLMRVEPEQYYYLPDQFHITVLSLFPATEDYAPYFEKKSEYRQVLSSILTNSDVFPVTFNGITSSRSAVMAKGFTNGPYLNQLRKELIEALHAKGLDEGLYSRYQRNAAHITIMRFRKQFENFPSVIDALVRFQNYRFGKAVIETLSFVEHDWYMSPEKTRILEEYHLKPVAHSL
jgi:tetratricopeptide (TPR) repeat protein